MSRNSRITAAVIILGLIVILLISVCGCTVVQNWLEKIPDGKRCISIDTPEKRVEICITKETILKEPEKNDAEQ